MKKVTAIVAGIFFTASAFAQLSWGVQGTGTLSNATFKVVEDITPEKKMKITPGGGLVVQYQVSGKFAIRSGINFLQQGIKLSASEVPAGGGMPSVSIQSNSKLNYLQLPVSFLYTMPAGEAQLYAGAGSYLNYGISGKTITRTVYETTTGKEVSEDTEDVFKAAAGNESMFKRVDLGVSVIAGIKFSNGMFANAGYQVGLSNIDRSEGYSYKNRGLQITIGYFLQ